MLGRTALSAFAVAASAIAAPASADSYTFPIDIRAQPLSSALRDLARQTGIELLFDRDMVRGMQAPRIKGRFTPEAALRQLLAGTDLMVRRGSSGAWLIKRRPRPAAPAPVSVEEDDAPQPEILVIGRRTQNVDIRRRENDVQPYQVSTGEQVVRAHRDDLDQYFRSRVTGNTQVTAPSLLDNGETNSAIDLRGLGTEGTMILVDGRRMPGVPQITGGMGQSDINAIPLHAIERIETLTGTAGGIHGFGALGGVVNVILKRDYRGAELHATAGIAARGDAPRFGIEGRIGFTPDGGNTDVMLDLSWSQTRPLLLGQRDYLARSRAFAYRFAPDQVAGLTPQGNAVAVKNFNSFVPYYFEPLVFKPEYGGGTLTSDYTFLPVGFRGIQADLVAALTRNQGDLDLGLTEAEAASQMGSNPTTLSVIANARHRFGGDVEAYIDALFLRNRGSNFGHTSFGEVAILPDAALNPFTQLITVTFPAPAEAGKVRVVNESMRLTAGLIVPLPRGWKGTGEASVGQSRFSSAGGTDHYYSGPFFIWGDGTDDPAFNPFGNWDDFQRAAATYSRSAHSAVRGRNRYQEQSLRFAGPLFATAGGHATLTLLAQRRREKVPRFDFSLTSDVPDTGGDTVTPAQAVAGRSLYAELRAPLFGDRAPVPLFNGLEAQLAIRYDHQKFDYASNPLEPSRSDVLHARFSGTAYTVGAKFNPLRWLMLRGSYATGAQPPSLGALLPYEREEDRAFLVDPKRGNDYFTDEGTYIDRGGGSPSLRTVTANTLSVGAVLNPLGDDAPRISLDYSRVDKRREVFMPGSQLILPNEEFWPERVVREPLTDADRALGYTGGRITLLDWSASNSARVRVETLDGRLDWRLPFASGTLHVYGAATLQLDNMLFEPLAEPVQRVGYYRGPLRWRANGGFDWTRGPMTIGANLQFFDQYRVYEQQFYPCCTAGDIEFQGSEWVQSQTYVDVYVTRRFRIGRHEVSVDLGIVNVFDQAQPHDFPSGFSAPGYSMYGDPRRRRFELVLSAGF